MGNNHSKVEVNEDEAKNALIIKKLKNLLGVEDPDQIYEEVTKLKREDKYDLVVPKSKSCGISNNQHIESARNCAMSIAEKKKLLKKCKFHADKGSSYSI